MKKILIILIIVLLANVAFCEDVISSLKKADSIMNQGTIIYNLYQLDDNETNALSEKPLLCKFVYNKDASKETAFVSEDNIMFTQYIAGDDLLYIQGKEMIVGMSPLKGGHSLDCPKACASNCYGRGLSLTQKQEFDPKTNVLTCNYNIVNRIMCVLDPEHGYAAKSIKVFNSKGKLIQRCVNSDFILVDGVYIASKSSYYVNEVVVSKMEIVSASFKEPTETIKYDLDKILGDIEIIRDQRIKVFKDVENRKATSYEAVYTVPEFKEIGDFEKLYWNTREKAQKEGFTVAESFFGPTRSKISEDMQIL